MRGAAALPFALLVFKFCRRTEQQHGLSDDAAEVGLQLDAIDPALLYLLEVAGLAQTVGYLTLHSMLIAATTEVEVALVGLVVEVNVGIDDGIGWIEDRTVVEVLEGACRRIADGHANLEVLAFVRRVLPVVGTIEEIVLATTLVNLRSPEAIEVPLVWRTTFIHLSARVPVDEVVAHKGFEAVAQRSAVHVVTPVAGMQQEGVAELQWDGVRHGACLHLGLLARIASEEA